MDTEIELKFLLSTEAAAQLPTLLSQLSAEIAPKAQRHLTNSYFDTEQRTLRSADIGLRTRFCNGIGEQTVKFPGQDIGGLHQRPEFNVAVSQNRPQLALFTDAPWPAEWAVAEIEQQLQPLFTTDFVRDTWLLTLANGSVIEVVLDQGEVIAEQRSEAILELELELKAGQRADLFALAEQIIQLGECRLGFLSKAARGYMLCDDTPLTVQESLGYVPVQAGLSQQQAFVDSVSYALRVIQHHEACFMDEPTLAALRKVQDGLALLRHVFWLYQDSIVKDSSATLRQGIKSILQQLAWVEQARQFKVLASKKNAYRKKLAISDDLLQVIKSQRASHSTLKKSKALFVSSEYNVLLLNLIRFVVEQQWLSFADEQSHQAAQTAVNDLAFQSLEHDWQEVQQLLPRDSVLSAEDYLAQQVLLNRNLMTGVCFANLYSEERRQEFRSPWVDLAMGMDELSTLLLLKQVASTVASDELHKLERWLEQRIESLLIAMEQSRAQGLKTLPYWHH